MSSCSRGTVPPIVVVAIDGVSIVWIGPPPGTPGDGDLAGDGSGHSRELIRAVRELWDDPIAVDHPSWRRPRRTEPGEALSVLATLLHLGHGRAVVVQAPDDALDALFEDPPS